MRIVQFETLKKGPRTGLIDGDLVYDLTGESKEAFSFLEILKVSSERGLSVHELVSSLVQKREEMSCMFDQFSDAPTAERACLRMPYAPPEVWGCGVTYIRSRHARETETTIKGIYEKVYEAVRPEIFFKATASRCVGPNEPIFIRSDSKWTVPEPELAFILGRNDEIAGYTIGNDVSSRDIEGENPLYLPQAKIYKGCCAVGPMIVTADEVRNPSNLVIECRIMRQNDLVFSGKTNTSSMKRTFDELRSWLCKDNIVPLGALCLTGTGIVPPDEFSLKHGDRVEIAIENIGTLRNPVIQL